MNRILYADPYVTLSIDDADGVVRYVRSDLPFPSIDELKRIHDRLIASVRWVPGTAFKLLLDARQAPPRNDEEFERIIRQTLDGFMPRFSAHAVLVKTAVGRLQVQRLERARGSKSPPVFEDEAAAVAYLRGAK